MPARPQTTTPIRQTATPPRITQPWRVKNWSDSNRSIGIVKPAGDLGPLVERRTQDNPMKEKLIPGSSTRAPTESPDTKRTGSSTPHCRVDAPQVPARPGAPHAGMRIVTKRKNGPHRTSHAVSFGTYLLASRTTRRRRRRSGLKQIESWSLRHRSSQGITRKTDSVRRVVQGPRCSPAAPWPGCYGRC